MATSTGFQELECEGVPMAANLAFSWQGITRPLPEIENKVVNLKIADPAQLAEKRERKKNKTCVYKKQVYMLQVKFDFPLFQTCYHNPKTKENTNQPRLNQI